MKEHSNIDSNKITIIVVEDDIGLNHLITEKIEELGYTCISALNLDDAKKLILTTELCFVFLDYSLGNKFSSELVRDLANSGITFPFVVLTGYSDTKIAVEFMKLGAYDFLIKSSTFLDEIESVLIKSINRLLIEYQNLELQKSLTRSERLYRLMADNMCDVVCKHDNTGKFTYLSPSIFTIFGYKSTELLDQHPGKFVHPDDLTKFQNKFDTAIEANIAWNLEYRFLNCNQEYIWVETYGTSVFDELTGAIEIQTVTRNINDRILAEAKLRHSEKQFRTAFENAAVGMSLRSLTGIILVANNALCSMLGYEKQELEGKNFLEFTHPEDRKLIADNIGKNPENITTQLQKRYFHKNGSIVWVSVCSNILTDEHNKPLYFIAQIQNITNQKKAEELASMDDARLESLLRIYEFQTYEINELLDFTLSELIQLTKSKIGYIYLYNEDKKQFILNSWSKDVMRECTIIDKHTIYDLEKTGLWGEAVRQGQPIIDNHFSMPHPLKKGYPEGHAKLLKYLTIPVKYGNKIVAVVGVANKTEDYDERDTRQLTLMMDSVWEISIRKKAEFELAGRLEMEQLIAEISSAFVTNASDKIDHAMSLVLSKIGLLTNADRAYVYISDATDTELNNTHEWSKNNSTPWKLKLQKLKINSFPWWAAKISKSEIINISTIAEMPPNATNEIAFLENLGIKSQLFVPLIYANKAIGLLGVAAIHSSISWSQKDIDFLNTVSPIIASALKHSDISHALKHSEERYRKLVDCLPDIVIMHDNGLITYVNDAAIGILGYRYNEFIGQNIFKFIEEDSTEGRDLIMKKIPGENMGIIEINLIGKSENKICIVRTELVQIDEKLLTLVVLSDITKRKELENRVARNIDKQSVLNSMLKLSLENISLDKLLEKAFDMLISIPWLTFEKKGCIFLVNDEGNLELKTQNDLSESILQTCKVIPFGK